MDQICKKLFDTFILQEHDENKNYIEIITSKDTATKIAFKDYLMEKSFYLIEFARNFARFKDAISLINDTTPAIWEDNIAEDELYLSSLTVLKNYVLYTTPKDFIPHIESMAPDYMTNVMQNMEEVIDYHTRYNLLSLRYNDIFEYRKEKLTAYIDCYANFLAKDPEIVDGSLLNLTDYIIEHMYLKFGEHGYTSEEPLTTREKKLYEKAYACVNKSKPTSSASAHKDLLLNQIETMLDY